MIIVLPDDAAVASYQRHGNHFTLQLGSTAARKTLCDCVTRRLVCIFVSLCVLSLARGTPARSYIYSPSHESRES